MLAETTCCLAASYPAKACGVKTGTLVREARKLCPNITFVKASHRKYVDYHHRIIEAVEKCLPVWKVFSIDEMAIQLFGREQELEFVKAKALEIKKRILEEVHPALTCSIGIAPNRYVAKIASDIQKPDGLTIIQSEELPDRLFDLELRDFPGIGARMEKRFIEARCPSARILCQKSPAEMRRLWGSKLGDDFWKLIHGEEVEERETKRGSISHSRVLPPAARTPEHAWSNLVALLSKAAMRLRQEGFFARTLQLNLKFLYRESGLNYWGEKSCFAETQDTAFLIEELSALWAEAPRYNILKVGIVLSSLIPADNRQLSLWEDVKQTKLMLALDKLNKAHRKNLVVFGDSSELDGPSHAPISFGHIPKKYE
jgi:DNA polymerase-4